MGDRLVSAFKQSWKNSQGDSFADRLSRMSLTASAEAQPQLKRALEEIESTHGEQLHIRLTGRGVKGNATDASALGRLYQAVAQVSESLNKSIAGIKIPGIGLLATAAVPGSVKLAFEVPQGFEQHALTGLEELHSTKSALDMLMDVFWDASDGDVESLTSRTAVMPRRARDGFREIAILTISARWKLEGTLVGPEQHSRRALLTADGASLLKEAAEATYTDSAPVTLTGTADGWAWSTSSLRFIPMHGQAFRATVPPPLQSTVANLIASDQRVVRASFTRTKVLPKGAKKPVQTTHSLSAIEVVEE